MPMKLSLPGYNLESKLDSQDATIFIGYLTLFTHFLATFFFLDIARGGTSDWIPSPIFEYQPSTAATLALIIACYSIIYMVSCKLLIRGVKKETRIHYFPWFIFTAIEIVLAYYQAFYLILRYSYDAESLIFSVVIIIVACYHFYLYMIVSSNYKFLKRIQNPTLIFPPDL